MPGITAPVMIAKEAGPVYRGSKEPGQAR